MADVERKKYARIMDEIEQIEDRLEELTGSDPDGELERLQEKLADRMRELARITDGCSRPGATGLS
jgi:hypothetical protein